MIIYLCLGLAYLAVDLYMEGGAFLAQIREEMVDAAPWMVPIVAAVTALLVFFCAMVVIVVWPALICYDIYLKVKK